MDALTDVLPTIEAIDGLVYCLGSINLKPFNRLSLEDFNSDLNVNFFGALKAFQHYLPTFKKSSSLGVSVLLSISNSYNFFVK